MASKTLPSIYLLKPYYVLALLVIGALAMISYFQLDQLTRSQESAATLINISGRQRMLSQRIALLANELVVLESPVQRDSVRGELLELIEEIRGNHQRLISGEFAPLSTTIYGYYYQAPLMVDAQLTDFMDQVNQVIDTSGTGVVPDTVAVIDQSSTLLEGLDMIVQQYEIEKVAEVSTQRLNLNVLLLTLMVLAIAFFLIFRSLERRIRQEEALLYIEIAERQKAEYFVKSVTEATPDIISVYDVDSGNVMYRNRFVPGYTAQQAVHDGIMHPDDYQRVFLPYQSRLKQGGEPEDIQYRIQNPTGEWRWFDNRNRVFKRDMDGLVQQIITVTQDITEQKQAEEKTRLLWREREKVRLLSEFINIVSHDLRTPLAIINTSSHLLSVLSDPEQRAAKSRMVNDQVKRISSLIDQFHFMAYLDTIVDLQMAEVDLNTMIENITRKMEARIKERHLAVNRQLKAGLLPVRGDSILIERALNELVDNAIRYAPEGSSITLMTDIIDQMVVIKVRDNSPAIDKADLTRIFEQFYKVDKARTEDASGAGLGLSIANKIVKLHHGEITAESEPGAGNTFSLRLPINDRAG